MIYTADDVLKVAKRFNNTRRNYLLVNPLQAKHLPTKPSVALEMINSLGKAVAKKFPAARLVIGFAETATALGAAVAKNLSDECFYLQTTRENFAGKFVEFAEEHSHAPEQKLYAENFPELINRTDEIIFVDDELSTGKTLLNVVRQLKNKFPALNDKKICAASIINRLAEENFPCAYLVKLNQTFDAENFSIEAAREVKAIKKAVPIHETNFKLDTRRGVKIGDYFSQCAALGNFIAELLKTRGEILILGTEEFMLPAIVAGRILEEKNFSVVTHSTTRSPIGISRAENYPIREGFKLRSFYDATRPTYIYNLKFYDAAIVVTDAENFSAGLEDLIGALEVHGVGEIFVVRCRNVRDL